MEGKDLRALRTSFGWSQESLAEQLGVDVTTVSRWERGKTREPITGTIIEAIGRNVFSGRSTRLAAYAETVIPAGLKFAVDEHPGLRFLFLSDELVMIRASREAVRAYPLMHTVMGVPFEKFMAERYKREYERAKSLPRDGLIAIKCYIHYDASVLKWHPVCYREYLISQTMPHILDVSGRNISKEEHDAQPSVFVPVYA